MKKKLDTEACKPAVRQGDYVMANKWGNKNPKKEDPRGKDRTMKK